MASRAPLALTDAERRRLGGFRAHGALPSIRAFARIILLRADGKLIKEIASTLLREDNTRVSKRTISYYIGQFERDRRWLPSVRTGRPPALPPRQREEARRIAGLPPSSVGVTCPDDRWSMDTLRRYLADHAGIAIPRSTLSYLLQSEPDARIKRRRR